MYNSSLANACEYRVISIKINSNNSSNNVGLAY